LNFQSQYVAEVIEQESHLLETCRYVVLNPVRAGLCRQPGSLALEQLSRDRRLGLPPEFLAADWVLGQFCKRPRQAALRYVEFVAVAIGDAARRATSGAGP
jgi:REP-associated tyrosine transposase